MAVKGRKKRPEEEVDTEAWMTTFADLVSLMLTFFILLVSMSTLDRTGLSEISSYFSRAVSVLNPGSGTEIQIIKPININIANSPRELMLAMRQKSTVVLKHSALEHRIKVAIIHDHLVMRVNNAVLFEPGQSALNRHYVSAISHLAKFLASSPGQIRVSGHTDSSPVPAGSPYPDQWSLSLARAASVLHVLENEGVNPGRLSLAGYGPSRPISTERTPYGRSRNRRVEIEIYASQ